jgi:hypothetical protein
MIGHCGVSDFSAYLPLGLGMPGHFLAHRICHVCSFMLDDYCFFARGVGTVAVILEWCGDLGCYVSTAL